MLVYTSLVQHLMLHIGIGPPLMQAMKHVGRQQRRSTATILLDPAQLYVEKCVFVRLDGPIPWPDRKPESFWGKEVAK